MTPTIGSRGLTDPVIQITLGSVTRSQQRRTGSVQTNLFGRTLDDPAAGFHRRVREMAAEQMEQEEATQSGSEREDDLVDNPEEDDEDDEADEDDEDEKEEEDPGYNDSGDNDEDDSPPASSHRLVTWSTPKKKPVPSQRGRPTGTNPGLGVVPRNGLEIASR